MALKYIRGVLCTWAVNLRKFCYRRLASVASFYKEKRLADPQDVTVAIWPSDKFITPEVILMLKLVIRVVSNPTRGII